MIAVAHPFGNANVRALLAAFEEAGLLAKFFTTIAFGRRSYDLPRQKIVRRPVREVVRHIAARAGLQSLIEHERGWASIDAVWRDLDSYAAAHLPDELSAVYAYEDCAEKIFEAAQQRNLRRIYELPIAYWETAQQLLREEAKRWPEWEPTLGGTRDSQEKLARKTRELELAELVVCPSNFVFDSLPPHARAEKNCIVAPFGGPNLGGTPIANREGKLRLLFAGAMSQRKGLADLFAAMKLISSHEIELVVMGSPLMPLDWYRTQYGGFVFESPRPHAEFLRLMQTCDVLVLPSVVEGRALVQQEAMASGLPLIATPNAGGDDLIEEGVTGFLVPIRSPEAIAAKISWCAEHREQVRGMGIAARERASEFTWRGYGEMIIAAVRALLAR